MRWAIPLYQLPLFLSVLFSLGLAALFVRRRTAPGSLPGMLLALSLALWSLAYALEIGAQQIDRKLLWENVQYLGITSAPVLWFLFARRYVAQRPKLSVGQVVGLAVIPLTTIALVWTSGSHSWMRSGARLDTSGVVTLLRKDYGPWFWVHSTYSYGMMVAGTVVLLQAMQQSPRLFRVQTAAVLVAAAMPWFGNGIYLLAPRTVGYLDVTAVAFTLSGVLVAWGAFRHGLLDLVPVARDAVMESLRDGVIVVDANHRVVDMNPAAQQILGCTRDEAVGRPATDALTLGVGLAERLALMLAPSEGAPPAALRAAALFASGAGPRYYDLTVSQLRGGQMPGRVVTIHDTTQLRLAQQAAQRRSRELSALNAISSAASSSLELPAALDALRAALTQHLDSPAGGLWLYCPDKGELRLEADWGLPSSLRDDLSRLSPDADRQCEWPEACDVPEHCALSLDGACRRIAQGVADAGGHVRICTPLVVGPSEAATGEPQGLLCLCAFGDGALRDERRRFVRALAQQVAVSLQNARLYEALAMSRERLCTLSRRLVEVQEVERRAVARELHDEVGQTLTGIKLRLEAAQPAEGSLLGQVRSDIDVLLDQVRQLSLDLRPAMLDDMGLLPALLWHLERYTERTGIEVDLCKEVLERRFPPDVETAAYRIVQEALTNVARHANVTRVTVRLWADEQALGVQVEDHGVGFDSEAAQAAGRSSGLLGMRERAALLGGQFSVDASPGSGTCVTAELPIAVPPQDAAADAPCHPS